jgi:hypothetical protein
MRATEHAPRRPCRLLERRHGLADIVERRAVVLVEGPRVYVGRPEADDLRIGAMTELGNGLSDAGHHEDALSVREAELAMKRRVGAAPESILCAQSNLATTYDAIGRHEDSLRMTREVYAGTLKLEGAEHECTLLEANNYACSLAQLERYKEAKSLLRRTIPVARRVHGDGHRLTLGLRKIYAKTLINDESTTLDDFREAVTTIEDNARVTRRVFGGAHPATRSVERDLQDARAALRARETPSGSA